MINSPIYIRTTSQGLCVSSITGAPRMVGSNQTLEFAFSVLSSLGDEYFFRYQMNERGKVFWHMYPPGQGVDAPADRLEPRHALGRLSPTFTPQELETLYFKVRAIPGVTHYLIVPGHNDCMERPDFLAFPLDSNTIAFLRTFQSVSDHFVAEKVMDSLQRTLADVRVFHLDGENRKSFLNQPGTELGMVNAKLMSEGFFLFRADDAPKFIKEAIQTSGVRPRIFQLDCRDGKKGTIIDDKGEPIGIIKDLSRVFIGYEDKVKQEQALEAKSRKEIPLSYDPVGSIFQGNTAGEDKLAAWMRDKGHPEPD